MEDEERQTGRWADLGIGNDRVAWIPGADHVSRVNTRRIESSLGQHRPAAGDSPTGASLLGSLLSHAPGETPCAPSHGRLPDSNGAEVISALNLASSGSAVSNLATPGTGVVPETVGKALAIMRRRLPHLVRHSPDLEVRNELCQQISIITAATAKMGILPLHQLATAVQIFLQEAPQAPSLIDYASLHTVGKAIDLLCLLTEKQNAERLKNRSPALILAVDDEVGIHQDLARQLGGLGLYVRSSREPNQVIPILMEQHYDLLLIDIEMPVLNGFELCVRIRNLASYRRTPIVFLAETTTSEVRVQATLMGGSDIVGKPIHTAEIGLRTIYWVLKALVP